MGISVSHTNCKCDVISQFYVTVTYRTGTIPVLYSTVPRAEHACVRACMEHAEHAHTRAHGAAASATGQRGIVGEGEGVR